MTITKRSYFGALAATGLVALLSSCSSSTLSTPRVESAELWSAASERYVAGDYLKASSNLDRLLWRTKRRRRPLNAKHPCIVRWPTTWFSSSRRVPGK